MMSNALWRTDSDNLSAYTEDRDVMRKVRRSYPDFTVTAEYFRAGELVARQYRIPSARKRSARNLLGVDVAR